MMMSTFWHAFCLYVSSSENCFILVGLLMEHFNFVVNLCASFYILDMSTLSNMLSENIFHTYLSFILVCISFTIKTFSLIQSNLFGFVTAVFPMASYCWRVLEILVLELFYLCFPQCILYNKPRYQNLSYTLSWFVLDVKYGSKFKFYMWLSIKPEISLENAVFIQFHDLRSFVKNELTIYGN